MANKTQRQIQANFRKVVKGKMAEHTISIPANGYHNNGKGVFSTRLIVRAGLKYKKKVKPFPRPNPDEDVRFITQREIFHGSRKK